MKNVLLVVKLSSPAAVPAEWARTLLMGRRPSWVRADLRRQKRARQAHEKTLGLVIRTLRLRRIPYKIVTRIIQLEMSPYDLVVSVGGDGTFLEAARAVGRQPILGVNSDPKRSVGSFCSATEASFERILDRTLGGSGVIREMVRMELFLNGKRLGPPVLNDVLVTHRKPAATSRYWLKVGGIQEVQRCSGLWLSTAAGSTGAIRSAGGRSIPKSSALLQYRPRELYQGRPLSGARSGRFVYRLKGGVVPAGGSIEVGSLMKHGLLCLDGEHVTFPFQYADVLLAKADAHPLRVVVS